MGILNVTQDSFSDGGRYFHPDRALARALEMVEEGADIIDIGGESTRPGAESIDETEEMNRVIPVIEKLSQEVTTPISIDTTKASVAEAAIQSGAQMVNDISALRFDPDMASIVSRYGVAVVLMHMKGSPKSMQKNPVYVNLMCEISNFLEKRISVALDAGISREKIIIDPGIGFGKTWQDNFVILNHLEKLQTLSYPLLMGVSRKSFIGWLLDISEEERLLGTAAAVTASVLKGTHIVRVHDVKEMVQVVKIADRISRSSCA